MSKRKSIVAALLLLVINTVLVAQQPARQPNNAAPADSTKTAKVLAATEEILAEVSKLRGLSILAPVKSGAKSRAEIEQEVVRNFEEKAKPAEIEASRKALVAFGLAPKDFRYREFVIQLLTEQVAGFYRPKSKELFIADWNDLEQQRPVMAHELIHALQDQHFNLRRFEDWPHGDSDRELAMHALIEGDATGVMYNFMFKPMGVDITRLPNLTVMADQLAQMNGGENQKVLAAAPNALRESLIFPYIYGAGFVQELVKKEGWPGVTRAFTELPQSTEQIIHYEKYAAKEAPVKVSLPDITSSLGAGWKRLDADINGEFGYFLILSEFIAKPDARRAAAGWGGDQFALYEDASGQLLIAHLSQWDTAADAAEFLRAYTDRTLKRYPSAKPLATKTEDERRFQTTDGQVIMQLRDKAILVIEGLPTISSIKPETLMQALWR
jgi:hypothetical protein